MRAVEDGGLLAIPQQRPPGRRPEGGTPELWMQRYARRAMAYDALALVVSGLAAVFLRFGGNDPQLQNGFSYVALALGTTLVWLAAIAFSRCYETRFLAVGTEEYRRLCSASLRLFGIAAFVAYASRTSVARGFTLVFLPLGLLALLAGRRALRVQLVRARRRGRAFHRTIAVGSPEHVRDFLLRLPPDNEDGLRVVGACLTDQPGLHEALPAGVPYLGTTSDVLGAVALLGADTVAVAPGLDTEALRLLAYDLEGTGVHLTVAPALVDVVGNRISIRPLAGMPLLHVDEPEFGGARKLVKGVFDRCVALAALVVLSPVLLAVAAVVRCTSRGPALFTQTRVGQDGQLFSVFKFRTMVVDAEALLAELAALNEADSGMLFKIRADPRVTRVGRVLRKWSLDELPQLLNVVRGDMSLVGPRPPLPTEVERYEGHTHRRLLVKPGITGLWQVSGRSDLTWDESVRLDLQYVENWSLGLDMAVLARTALAVVRSAGAY
ncbi:MAG: sugar transferase [Mycobacteriales bacterium]